MTYTPDAFRTYCHDAAKHFLQTAVVIDNEAVFDMDRYIKEAQAKQAEAEAAAQKEKIVEPPSGTLKGIKLAVPAATEPAGVAKEVTPQKAPPTPPDFSHLLDAKLLIDGFSDSRIVCSVICPGKDEAQAVERAIKVAVTADIVVVDWMLDKVKGEAGSKRARDIIKGIIEKDIESRGRLRLIAVYTAEDSPVTVLDHLFDHIKDMDFMHDKIKISKDEKTCSIRNSHLKIAVLSKPSVKGQVGVHPIPFAELPGKLLDLFCDLNMGLLPSVALHSIAAIREETHHLLAVLHGKLDPALVGHRCLLETPDDAEEFCEDLVAGELRGILSTRGIGKHYLDLKANKKWIGSRIKKDEHILYDDKFRFTRDHAFSLAEKGIIDHKSVLSEIRADWLERKVSGDNNYKDDKNNPIDITHAKERLLAGDGTAITQFKIPSISEKDFPQILNGNKSDGDKINREFSRLCALKREAYGLRRPFKDWVPQLTLGTIIQQKGTDKFFICLQPRCDSVRLTIDQNYKYPFLAIGEGKKKGVIIVRGLDATSTIVDKELTYEPLPRHQVIFEFKCYDKKGIIAYKTENHFVFTELTKQEGQVPKEYYWIADIKDFIAQRIADDLSTRIGSVGLDEYEWLRRKAK